MNFDEFDTKKLKNIVIELQCIYAYNYDNSRKSKLLCTIINKLHKLINECGYRRQTK